MSQHRRDRFLARDIGRHLRAMRVRLGLTQDQWAAHAGVTRAAICNHEKGLSTPSLTGLYKLADAVGVDVRRLLPR